MTFISYSHYKIMDGLLKVGEEISRYPLSRFNSATHSPEFNRELILDLAKEYKAKRVSSYDNLHAIFDIAKRTLFRLETSKETVDVPREVFKIT